MKIEIRQTFSNKILFSTEAESLKDALEKAYLFDANLDEVKSISNKYQIRLL